VSERDFRFRSDRGRPDLNPYVDRMHEFGPWVLGSQDAEKLQGAWQRAIGLPDDAPLILEIGPGNGFFFREVARRWPEAAVVGVEIRFKRVWLTAKKALQWELENFRVVHHTAFQLGDLFRPASLSAVFVNHPDPWPKDRHHKHRLLQPSFEEAMAALVAPGGELWVKSDFAPYGPLARATFDTERWSPVAFTADLHGADAAWLESPPGGRWFAADLQTNYERKFIAKQTPIAVAGFERATP
jgi:tRNA (guanine-N7-)-methyltransferase